MQYPERACSHGLTKKLLSSEKLTVELFLIRGCQCPCALESVK